MGTSFSAGTHAGAGEEGSVSPQVAHQSSHVGHTVDGEPLRQRGLGGVLRRDEQLPHAGLPGRRAMGSTPVTPRSAPVRDSSPMKAASAGGGGSSPPAESSPTKMGRSYTVPAFFWPAGARFTVIRLTGNFAPAVFHRRPDPLPGFPHGGVRQTYDVKGGKPAGEKAFRAHLIPPRCR